MNLETITYKDTIPFIVPIKSGKVIKVYDGDTITIATKLPFNEEQFYRFSVRLAGIDCPEIRSKNESEKECAILARDFVQSKIFDKIVSLNNIKMDKYGRLLADVIFEDVSISNLLLENRLAVSYEPVINRPKDWLKYHLKNNYS